MKTDRFLRLSEAAAMLGTTCGVAAQILLDHKITPVDLDVGRSRGKRWRESDVVSVMNALYEKSRPGPKREKRIKGWSSELHLWQLDTDQVMELTKGQPLQ